MRSASSQSFHCHNSSTVITLPEPRCIFYRYLRRGSGLALSYSALVESKPVRRETPDLTATNFSNCRLNGRKAALPLMRFATFYRNSIAKIPPLKPLRNPAFCRAQASLAALLTRFVRSLTTIAFTGCRFFDSLLFLALDPWFSPIRLWSASHASGGHTSKERIPRMRFMPDHTSSTAIFSTQIGRPCFQRFSAP